MQMVRTTIRLREPLKKDAERMAVEENTTLQAIINHALLEYLAKRKDKNKPIKVKSFNLGAGLDKITRDDIYGDPDFS